MGEMMRGEVPVEPPAGRYRCEWPHDEASLARRFVRNGEPALSPFTACPGDDVEVEDSGAPAASAPSAELALHRLERLKHEWRLQLAFDESDGIGEVAAGTAMRGIEQDGRRVEQAECLIERGASAFGTGDKSAGLANRIAVP